jgi:tetratricopeptide (TPR) repeat protein
MSAPHPAVARAQALFRAGQPRDAERALLDALDPEQTDLVVLNALAALLLETRRLPDCARVLSRVIELAPTATDAYHTLAAVLNELGRYDELTELYARLAAHRPDDPLAHYNLACCLRRDGHLERALEMHERAIALGLPNAEEGWTNIGVLLGELNRHGEARTALDKALSLNPRWLPALYNLALWFEEHGDAGAATATFERLLALDPEYHAALVRLAHLKRIESRDDPVVERLSRLLERPNVPRGLRENVHFALAKALDDCGNFDAAWTHVVEANAFARTRMTPYDRGAAAQRFERIRAAFARGCPAISDAPLVFLCGIYRSGTTLLEQMLAAHPRFVAGGEIDYLRSRLDALLAALPDDRAVIGRGYLDHLAARFAHDRIVVDKQPDNALLIGLLAQLFPNARFLTTTRELRNTALSIYFQPLDNSLPWATDVGDIVHQIGERERLLAEWRTSFGARMLDIAYESLVDDAPAVLQRVCSFLGVEWREEMLSFQSTDNRVRTASVWQVRQPLYRASLDRARHYAAQLDSLGVFPR